MALLRNIETHVRVMAERDSLTLGEKSVSFGSRGAQLPRGGQFSNFTRVHKEKENEAFFENAIRKLVTSAAAGQHHTVLICGPPQSGRSQTMYDVQGAGLVNLTAAALLKLPDATVHYTAYNVRGQHLYDSFTGAAIETVELPAPIGPMPLSAVRLLEKPSDAVVVPKDKRADTSSFICFHVYRPVTAPGTGQRRDAFSTITFVDVCSFGDTLPSDLQKLSSSIDKVLLGSDPQFNACALTQLLEHSVKGGRTMTAVCAITGGTSTSVAACHSMDFLERLGRVGQVAPLCQLIPPKWVDDLPRGVEAMELSRQQQLEVEYHRGVATAYNLFCDVLTAKQKQLQTEFHSDSAFEDARRRLAENLRQRLESLQQSSSQGDEAVPNFQREARRFRTAAEDLERKHAALMRRVAAEEQTLREVTDAHENMRAEATLELSRFEAERHESDRRMLGVKASINSLQAALQEANSQADEMFDRVRRATLIINRDNALSKLDAKRRRIEQELVEMSSRAADMFTAAKEEQQRKSQAAGIVVRAGTYHSSTSDMRQAVSKAAGQSLRGIQSPNSAEQSPHNLRAAGKKSRSRAGGRQPSNAAAGLL